MINNHYTIIIRCSAIPEKIDKGFQEAIDAIDISPGFQVFYLFWCCYKGIHSI